MHFKTPDIKQRRHKHTFELAVARHLLLTQMSVKHDKHDGDT